MTKEILEESEQEHNALDDFEARMIQKIAEQDKLTTEYIPVLIEDRESLQDIIERNKARREHEAI